MEEELRNSQHHVSSVYCLSLWQIDVEKNFVKEICVAVDIYAERENS